MKLIKNIFTAFLMVVFTTTDLFAVQDCTNPTYRRAHPDKCQEQSGISNGTLLKLAGGLALIGTGVALATQSSSGGDSPSTPQNQNNYSRLTLSDNIITTYAPSDTIQNNRASSVSYQHSYESGQNIDNSIIKNIKQSPVFKKNLKQFEAINLAYASARGFTGKNIKINILDDFNGYHGYAVSDVTRYIAPNATIKTYNITSSVDTLVSYDTIADIMQHADSTHIYNASWQIPSSIGENASTAIYNDYYNTKTYAQAQAYMYNKTSNNFITQIRNSAIENDSIFVWAAGNESATESGVLSALPLAFPDLNGHFVNVVALDTSTNKLAWYSNQCGITQNYCITAPGSHIKTETKTYALSGTSYATPVVSGAIAVIKEAFPYMTANQITELLFTTAKDIGETGIDAVYGWGLLDLDNATRPQGKAKIILSDNTIQPLTISNVSGSAAAALKNANIQIAFVDDFGRAFTTNLSDNINIIPYGRGFDKLREQDNDAIVLFDTLEMGFKPNHLLESSGLISVNSNNMINFVGYKNEFTFQDIKFYQNIRVGSSTAESETNSIISGFSNIYSMTAKTGAKIQDFQIEVGIPETIINGAMYMNIPIAKTNDGTILYDNVNVNLATKPSIEYTVKYKYLSATYINNPDYQDEFFVMAKTKFAF